jgi:hypothetical protein
MAPGDRKLRVCDEYLTSVWMILIEDDIKLFSQSCSIIKYAAYFNSDDSKLVALNMKSLIFVFDSESGDAILNFPAMNNDDEVLGVGSKKNIRYTHCDRRLGVWDCELVATYSKETPMAVSERSVLDRTTTQSLHLPLIRSADILMSCVVGID